MILCSTCGNPVDEKLGRCAACGEHGAGVDVDKPQLSHLDLLAIKAVEVETEFWESIKHSDDALDFREYLEHYPKGLYEVIARNRLRKLQTRTDGHLAALSPASANPSPPLTPGKRRMLNRCGIEMVWIPPGTFMMGSENGESDEKPVHQVTISTGFYLGQFQITQAQWQMLMGDNPSFNLGNNHPVESVSWIDVQEFIRRLNQDVRQLTRHLHEIEDGRVYRLPTEAEWEYACRAGSTEEYAGDFDAMAWYSANSDDHTQPVGARRPNAFGLYDMYGNVWEWCHDWYNENYYRYSTAVDPQGPVTGTERVLRGGSWGFEAIDLRSACRGMDSPSADYTDGGFRVVAVEGSL